MELKELLAWASPVSPRLTCWSIAQVHQLAVVCSSISLLPIPTSKTSLLSLFHEHQPLALQTRSRAALLLVGVHPPVDYNVIDQLLLGELEPEYEAISGNEHIPTWPINNPYRWNLLLDALIVNDTITVPTTKVTGAPSNKAVVLMDSGSSYTYVHLT